MSLLLALLFMSLLQLNATEHWNSDNNHNLLKAHRSIQKCCPFDQYIYDDDFIQLCVQMKNNNSLDFSDLLVYDDDISEVRNSAKYSFDLKYNDDFFKTSIDSDLFGLKHWLTESGILYVENPNYYKRWSPIPTNEYCLEYKVTSNETNDKPVPHFWIVYVDVEQPNPTKDYYEAAGLLISCVFLMLVLFVYLSLEYLRNINGMILMAYAFSLFIAFLLLATIKIFDHPTPICIGLTSMVYFFFLASFFWMNVMSFDIWKTFSACVNARRVSRGRRNLEFQIYCAYAYGVPLVMTVGLIVLNQSDMSHLPWFVTPKIAQVGCFIYGGEKFLYLYIPMLLLIICNWVFYLLTARNLWCLHRDTAVVGIHHVGNKAAQHNYKKRFLVYIYLSIVMGLSWIFEIMSFFSPNLPLWYITDSYNALIGPMIFFIFIWKKKVFNDFMSIYGSEEKPFMPNFNAENNYLTEEFFINKEVLMQATKQT